MGAGTALRQRAWLERGDMFDLVEHLSKDLVSGVERESQGDKGERNNRKKSPGIPQKPRN